MCQAADPTVETVELVQEAVRYARANGSFARGEHDVFAHGLAGTALALPADPASAGTSQRDLTDPDGVRIVRAMREAARDGGGFVAHISYHRLDRSGTWEKRFHVVMAGEDWFIGSGTYA